MRLLALLLLALTAFGQRTRPSMIVTPTLLAQMKARARANTTEWQELYGTTLASQTCQWAIQYYAASADHLPPVIGYREPPPVPGAPPGGLSTGPGWGAYQGGSAASSLLNMAACYLTLKDGDVDLVGSAAGTADEVAQSVLLAKQAVKVIQKFNSQFVKVFPTVLQAKWEALSWMPAYYVDLHATDTTGCTVPGERRVMVYMRLHALTVGTNIVMSGILGGLSTMNGNTYTVSATGLTSVQFELEQGGSPVCSSLTGTNYNSDFQNDDGYPMRYGVGPPALAMDWLWNSAELTPTIKASVIDGMEGWIQHSRILDSSARALFYESRTQSNYHWGYFNGYGLAGIALTGEDSRGDEWYQHWRNVMWLGRDEPYLRRWLGNGGSFYEAWQYFPLEMQYLIVTILADETALGDNLLNHPTQPITSFFEGQLTSIKHIMQPNPHRVLELNTGTYPNGGGQVPFEINRINTVALYPILYMADRQGYANRNKFRKIVSDAKAYLDTATGYPAGSDTSFWSTFLFWDPTGTLATWDDAPLSTAVGSNPEDGWQYSFMRSDWTTSAVYAGYYGGIMSADPGNGKELVNRGSLQVQRGDVHLLVNPRMECLRNLAPTYAGNEALNAVAMACYDMTLNQTSNQAYQGGTAFGVYYNMKPGQMEGPLKYGIQITKPQFLGIANPWLPGSDPLPDQVIPIIAVDAAADTLELYGLPLGNNITNGNPAYITYGTGVTEGAPPGGLVRGERYFVRALSGSKIKLATTNSDATIVNLTSAGTGPQYVVTGKGPANITRYMTWTHPTKMDRYVDGATYVYTRSVNLHQLYSADPVYTTHYPLRDWTREIIYLRPKIFVVYDRTTKLTKISGTSKTIGSVSPAPPIVITTTTNHGYHTGMTITITCTGGVNRSGLITVNSSLTFTMDGALTACVSGTPTSVSGTVRYVPTMAWLTGKTPVVVSSPTGTIRYDVSNGATFKGSITSVFPSAQSTAVRDIGGYGMLHQILVSGSMFSDDNNFLAVVDASDGAGTTSTITPLTTAGGIQAISIDTTAVVGFVGTLPATYVVPGSTTRTHYIAGLTPSTAYYLESAAGGTYHLRESGPGATLVSSAQGLVVFTSSPEGGVSEALALTPGVLPTAHSGIAYSAALTASGGTVPYVFSLVSTSCTGLTVNSAGTVSWPDPTTACSFTAKVTDSGAAEVQQVFGVSVIVTPPSGPSPIGEIPLTVERSGPSMIVTVQGQGIRWDTSCTVSLFTVGAEDPIASQIQATGIYWRQYSFTGLEPATVYTVAASCRTPNAEDAPAEASIAAPATPVVSGLGTVVLQGQGAMSVEYCSAWACSATGTGTVTVTDRAMGVVFMYRMCSSQCGAPILTFPKQ